MGVWDQTKSIKWSVLKAKCRVLDNSHREWWELERMSVWLGCRWVTEERQSAAYGGAWLLNCSTDPAACIGSHQLSSAPLESLKLSQIVALNSQHRTDLAAHKAPSSLALKLNRPQLPVTTCISSHQLSSVPLKSLYLFNHLAISLFIQSWMK